VKCRGSSHSFLVGGGDGGRRRLFFRNHFVVGGFGGGKKNRELIHALRWAAGREPEGKNEGEPR